MKRAPCFDCLVQTSGSNKVQAVCYDPQQRKHLIQPKQQKSLVKITVIVNRDWQISWRNSRHQSDIRRDKSQYCVGIKKAKSCVGCNDTFNGEIKEMVTWFSCATTMLFSECATKLVCNLAIKREKLNAKVLSYTCSNNGLQSLLASVNKSHINLNDICDKQ